MKYLISITIFLTTSISSFSQDNLLNSTCSCLDKLLKLDMKKVDFQFAHEDCFKDVYTKTISFTSQESSDAFCNSFMEDLKSKCDSYNMCHDILDRMTLEKSEVLIKNKKTCRQTMQVGEFEDRSGTEKVIMSMRDSIQVVTFGEQGLYTKSKIQWTDECSYKVIFIESTNPFENAVLKKGDEREIRIIDIKNNGEIIFEVGMYDRWFLGKVTKLK